MFEKSETQDRKAVAFCCRTIIEIIDPGAYLYSSSLNIFNSPRSFIS